MDKKQTKERGSCRETSLGSERHGSRHKKKIFTLRGKTDSGDSGGFESERVKSFF